jgi:hypothetical protein
MIKVGALYHDTLLGLAPIFTLKYKNRLKVHAGDKNTLAYFAKAPMTEKKNVFIMKLLTTTQGPYSQLMNGSKKLECYITEGRLGFSGTNTLAYWAHSSISKKRKCC